MTPSRRTTLQWMIAAAAMPLARWASPASAAEGANAPPFDTVADWPGAPPPLVATKGYGRDPTLMEPKVVWPLTLTRAQRATVDLLGDMILPADDVSPGAGQLGVGAFIDEWISAPYPTQQGDRATILGGLDWLDRQSIAQHGKDFAALGAPIRGLLLDALCVAVPSGKLEMPVKFMDRLRHLFVLGFYTLPEGKKDMGHVGDQPTEGPYPGPSVEARTHLAALLAELKLGERTS
ncbi:gluconate 2-dehydrogenase subunit 3 family protein [Sphingomonas qomolangmaensis]|uniref:Gluconate 2-dehydrogenase subunit 3 family protein n=1 Tax=Sphingomonas qomolangmaensis TaxID=2918765 RepID=A0ABY5L6B3_9SPHN|nr:gluconate 2-dehydrogenase subunit 3 family protein [Sphingomonas qomolangmaensis]UUL82495.1 gluconate 2-dehydrogenase subunit 3 family protein [Sphingomonas qomolangmaensis]